MSYFETNIPANHLASITEKDVLPFWSAFPGKILLDHIPLRKAMQVLDIGCGTGFPLFEIAMRLGTTARLTGIDIREDAIAQVIRKKEQHPLPQVGTVCCDAASLPFGEKEFDLITSNLGFGFFDAPQQVVRECYRVLKRPGRLCLTVHTEGYFREFFSIFENMLKDLGEIELLTLLKTQEQRRFTDETLRDLLEDNRFSVLKIIRERYHIRYMDGTALLNGLLASMQPNGLDFLPQEKRGNILKLLKQKLDEQADWDGELKLSVPFLYAEAVK